MKIGIKKLISWVLCLIMLLSMMPLNVIAEEGDNGTDTGTVETNPPDQPPTGDNSNLWLWVMLLGVSAVAIVGLAVVLTKKKRKEK